MARRWLAGIVAAVLAATGRVQAQGVGDALLQGPRAAAQTMAEQEQVKQKIEDLDKLLEKLDKTLSGMAEKPETTAPGEGIVILGQVLQDSGPTRPLPRATRTQYRQQLGDYLKK